jgi:hypothetical protein
MVSATEKAKKEDILVVSFTPLNWLGYWYNETFSRMATVSILLPLGYDPDEIGDRV